MKNQNYQLLFLSLFLLFSFGSFAQTIKVTGKVTDSIKKPLEYANVFAVPADKSIGIAYSISNENGNYQLKLQKNKTYKVTTSFLGYVKQEKTFNFAKDTVYNFVLKEDKNQLDEVTLTYTIPVKVKQDTITYNTDSFKTGEERKLKDVLKKLPGIEVDRQGNVTANGKKIKKLLVEDKPFFGGSTKLGVNNIPADAVDKVQVLENYNSVAMLKGLQDSDDSVLNIKLKKDKKKFVFGDIEVGAGIKNRYLLHPKLFYYSPNTSVNFIGDVNNTGVKSFTFKDYLSFEGGISKIFTDVKSYFDLYNSDFAKYLNNQNFIDEKNNFGAFSVRQSINEASDLSTYVIASKATTKTQIDNQFDYLTNTVPFTENRTNTNNIDTFFTIGKITLDYDPNKKTDYAFASFVKLSNSNSTGKINTISDFGNNYINSLNKTNAVNLKQSISLNKNASKKHTVTLNATYTYQKNTPKTQWQTNQLILQNSIPLQQANEYKIFQDKYMQSNEINLIVKDYWIVHRFHHIYTSVGAFSNYTNLSTNDGQVLDNQSVNSFYDAGFNNKFNYQFLDAFLGLEYKFKVDKTTFKPAIFYHNYRWKTKQIETENTFYKNLFLPKLDIKVNFRSSEKLQFRYQFNARFPSAKYLADRFVLTNFNQVFKGNNQLENTLYHRFYLRYYKFNMFRGYHFSIGTNWYKRIKSLKSATDLEGINQFTTKVILDKPESQISIDALFSKRINNIKYQIASNVSDNTNYQIINQVISKTTSVLYGITPSVKTFFKKYPNLELGYKVQKNQYTTSQKTEYLNEQFYAYIDYDFLKDFIFNSDISYTKYTDNSNNKNTFLQANAKLFYQKEDSPWGFELQARNILDTKYKQNNSITDFIVSDTKTYLVPRIFMLKVFYKL